MQTEVVTYSPEFKRAFADLNYAWIEQYFVVEEEDRRALENPESYALQKGGEIFFVIEHLLTESTVVGCVAMVPFKSDTDAKNTQGAVKVFELAKMAVSPACQGKGYSHLLMQACIDFAVEKGAQEIMLVTNDVLKPALGLYEKAGFIAQPTNSDSRYARSNLEMKLVLPRQEGRLA